MDADEDVSSCPTYPSLPAALALSSAAVCLEGCGQPRTLCPHHQAPQGSVCTSLLVLLLHTEPPVALLVLTACSGAQRATVPGGRQSSWHPGEGGKSFTQHARDEMLAGDRSITRGGGADWEGLTRGGAGPGLPLLICCGSEHGTCDLLPACAKSGGWRWNLNLGGVYKK